MTLLLIVFVPIAAIVVFAMTKPNEFLVQRSASIDAAPEKIFPLIDDFHAWAAWSPWEKLDPALNRTYSGASRGVGAVYEWSGNGKVGTGRMEIVEASPFSSVTIALDFLKPFKAHNTARFTLTPQGGGTRVVWEMRGRSNFMSKVMQVFMSMDKMIGPDFEKGLANMKTAVS